MKPGERAAAVRGAALGLAFALALSWLLDRLLLHGQAQSFDPMLYARSLWGAAHASWHNPVIDKHALAVHAQLLSYVLAPLTFVVRPVQVLIAAQAVALGVTVAVTHQAFYRATAGLAASRRALLALLATAIALLGTPLLLNPFLFDARPDLLGVPPALIALLRARERRGFDAGCLLWFAAATLAREEFAVAAAASLVLAPAELRAGGLSLRARLIWAAVFATYLGAVLLFAQLQASSVSAHLATSDHTPAEQLLYRVKLVAAVLLSAGGLVLLGLRALGPSVPGIALLAASSWMLESQLSFHYGMFAAPGLVLAALAGFDRLGASGSQLLPRLAGAGVLAAAMYAATAAAPGGAAFAARYFDLDAAKPKAGSWLREVHAVLGAVPAGAGLALPYQFAAPYAGREAIWSTRRLEALRDQRQPLPRAIDYVGLLREDFAALGPYLRAQGFALVKLVPGAFALLAREPKRAPPWNQIRLAQGCRPSEVSWPRAGFALCNLWRERDGRAALSVQRVAAGDLPAAEPLFLLEAGAPPRPLPFLLLDGLIGLRDLPLGAAVKLYTPAPVPGSSVRLRLEQADQIQPAFVNGRERPSLPIQLVGPTVATAH